MAAGRRSARCSTSLGIKSEFRGGFRVTDKQTVEVVEMVLAGSINKEIVMAINAEGGKAVGLSGKDGNMVFAERVTRTMKDPDSNIERVIDLGFVGEPKTVNRAVIDMVLSAELIPVIAPVAPGPDGQTYNVNADTFAGAIAGALGAARLLFLTDVPGVLDGKATCSASSPFAGRGADRRRHRPRRHDPEGGDLPRGPPPGRRGRRHPQRQDAARRAPRALHRPRRRHADPAMTAALQDGIAGGPARDLARFAPIDAWVFDLDNTLYPRHTNLYVQVDQRIRTFVASLLDLVPEEAQRVQKDYYRRYGTTLRGLMVEHGIAPDAFLEYVHDIDHSPVEADPRLAAAIERLPGKRYHHDQRLAGHAEKVAERLGISGHFDDIFDIVRAELLPKPNRETYDRFLAATGVRPGARGDVRGPRPQPGRPAGARHGDGAGRAGRHARGVHRGMGARGPRGGACRVPDRRSRRVPGRSAYGARGGGGVGVRPAGLPPSGSARAGSSRRAAR